MIQGLCAAYQATGTAVHVAAVRRAADFMQDKLSSSLATSSAPPRWWKAFTARISPLASWPLLKMFRLARAGRRSMADPPLTCAGIARAMHR
jgi:hypothetical protein